MSNSSEKSALESERATDKYFAFEVKNERGFFLEYRVDKCSYIDRFNAQNASFTTGTGVKESIYENIGKYNKTSFSTLDVKELAEYLWQTNPARSGKVMSSQVIQEKDEIRVVILEVISQFGDWGMDTYVNVGESVFGVNKNTGIISLKTKQVKSFAVPDFQKR
jgi:hypothetical protein